MAYQDIAVTMADTVCTITLNRPDKLNAWTPRMESEFRSAVQSAAQDNSLRAIVVTGAGRGFCAGADMSILEAGAAGDPSADDASVPVYGEGEGIDANYAHRFRERLNNRPAAPGE